MSYRGGQRGSRAARPATFNLRQFQSGIQSLRRAASAAMDPGEAWLQEGERQARNRPQPYGPPIPDFDIYEQPGVGLFNRRTGEFLGRVPGSAPPAPVLPPPGAPPGMGVTPAVRQEDDQYRQLLSQYGALQKEKKFDEATTLGRQIWAEKYKDTPLTQPKTENPLMRSMREMFPSRYGETPALESTQPVPEFGARGQAGGGYAGTFREQPGLFQGSMPSVVPMGDAAFSMAANAVPAPWNTQGQAVSAPYREAMSKAFEKTNPMNLLSQQPAESSGAIRDRVNFFLGQGK